MVRDTGQVITGTGYSATTLGLPTEERETREQARARIEAKRARQRTTSPFGHLPPALDDSATAAQKRARTHNLQHPLSEDGVVQGAAARAAAEEAARERAAAIAADADARRRASRPAPSNAARDPELVRAIVDAYTGPEQATVPALAARHERSRDLVRKILVAAGVELRDDRARNGANLDAVRPTTARRAPEPTPEPVAPQEPTSEPEPAPALEDHPDVRAFFAALQDALDSGAEAVLADVRNATSRLRARAVANRRVAAANRGEAL